MPHYHEATGEWFKTDPSDYVTRPFCPVVVAVIHGRPEGAERDQLGNRFGERLGKNSWDGLCSRKVWENDRCTSHSRIEDVRYLVRDMDRERAKHRAG